jgi:Spy/CpxP family protein refolding chaperone
MKCFPDRTALPHARQALMAATAALVLSFGVGPASAQPAGGPHGMHGMHGGAGIEQMIPRMLERAKANLNLNTSQQVSWDNAVAQSKAAHEAARANRQQVKAALTAELAKPEPDLAAVIAVADSVEQQNRALRINARNQWLQLYAALSPEQKGVARDLLQKRLQHAESLGAKIREHMQAMHPLGG